MLKVRTTDRLPAKLRIVASAHEGPRNILEFAHCFGVANKPLRQIGQAFFWPIQAR